MTASYPSARGEQSRAHIDHHDAAAARRLSTETKSSFTTTEFWLTVVGVVALVILAYNSDLLGVRYGMAMATAVLFGYIISRGIAKAG